ncbi:amidohydrolase family protein [Novosphingobium sp. KCTC 2891]|uniref:amidohydrolase family protein n=1 Tax=unclassified Novosphingobium TaxID=2644732 RepID=UPI002221F699|nr:amidohydrolase family protein [Novosphingobium sp. KCTC 2891]MCW1384779.1 amidohydrolase family protein [Novosphingobium sp. KCTC 2891]
MTLVLRAVRPWGGALVDVALADGRIAAVGPRLPRGDDEIDGRGGVLLPGLHDHHLHLLALAARRHSVSLAGLVTADAVHAALAAAPPGPWLRATDYDERAAGLPDAALLDRWSPDRPLRLADRTGALRVLNSAALALLVDRALPRGAERDASGRATGRFWREDQWLAAALPQAVPDLAVLGGELAALGLTALTDAGAHNGPVEAGLLVGALPQRLVLMGSEALGSGAGGRGAGYTLGPLKLLIDEAAPPQPDALAARISWARHAGRAVAAHCVTEGELALFLAALAIGGGAQPGDRIEHGGMIPASFVPEIAAAGLTVVTNPAFLHDRGDRYRATIAAEQHAELYPAASLARAGIALRAGSDAPYAGVDPWLGMRSARDRRTADGHVLAPDERLSASAALALYCAGTIAPGAPADLIVCAGTMVEVFADLTAERVQRTLIGGEVAFSRG